MTDHVDTTTKHFTITRVFDAPRAAIWHAWTDPDEAAAWWHPLNVSTPRDSVELDVRPGGRYRYTMIGPDGTEYPTVGVYREVVEPERLVFTWASPGDPDDAAPVITVTLAEHGEAGEQTHMRFELTGWDGEPGDGNVYDGWSQAFDELDGRLAPTIDGAR